MHFEKKNSPPPTGPNPHLHGVSNAEASSDDGGHIETCISNLHWCVPRVWGHDGTGGGGFWWIFEKTRQKTGFFGRN